MFKIVTEKTFNKIKENIKRKEDKATAYLEQAHIMFNLSKTNLEEAINDYFLICGEEQRLSVDKVSYKIQYVIFKDSIYSRVVTDYKESWKKDKDIPTEVFNYFYNNKKCD